MPRKKRASVKKTKKARKPSSRLDALISQIVPPVFIGIDEVFFGGIQDKPRQGRKYRCTLAGLRPRRFVALLPTRRIAYLQRILGNIPEEEQKKVRVIVMDMWKPFRLLAQRILPWALIVVDRFHIVKEANKCLDAVRIAIQKTIVPAALDAAQNEGVQDQVKLKEIKSAARKKKNYLVKSLWVLLKRKAELDVGEMEKRDRICLAHSALGIAYELKERFYAIWDEAKDPAQARAMYEAWRDSIPEEQIPCWSKLITTMTNWGDEVFNYFVEPDPEKRLTNSYTEHLNGEAKKINQETRGCRLETIWWKLAQRDKLEQERNNRRHESQEKDKQAESAGTTDASSDPANQASIQNSLQMAARRAASIKQKRSLQNWRTKRRAAQASKIANLFPSASPTAESPAVSTESSHK